jgi:hypothetical protein
LDGSPICLIAEKAINGLRTSGLAWVEHLSNLVQELGLHPSPIEPTVFAGYSKAGKGKTNKLIQIIAYVGDLLVFASSKEEAMIVFNHLANHLRIKQTAEINTSENGGGSLRFLGRTIERKPSSRTLTVKLDDAYLDNLSYLISYPILPYLILSIYLPIYLSTYLCYLSHLSYLSYLSYLSFLSYPILSYSIVSYPILSYLSCLSYPMLSYPILSYPILSYACLFV